MGGIFWRAGRRPAGSATALLISGVALAILATVLYARTGMRAVARRALQAEAQTAVTFNLS